MKGWALVSPLLLLIATASGAQVVDSGGSPYLPPPGYGTLSQGDLSLRLRNDDLEVRFVPLDQRVTRLLGKDAWESLSGLTKARQAAIDSLANEAGVTHPGLALVTFFGQRVDAKFDPQTLNLVIRNRIIRPLGIVPISPQFSSQQLGIREQVSGIYLFEEEFPVNDSFAISYGGINSEDWLAKQRTLERERARVALRVRGDTRDPSPADSAK